MSECKTIAIHVFELMSLRRENADEWMIHVMNIMNGDY